MITLPPAHEFAKLETKVFRTLKDAHLAMRDIEELPFFKMSDEKLRPDIRKVVKVILDLTPELVKFVQAQFDSKILHLSLGGSAVFRSNPADLDFNLIVSGSHFSYREYAFSQIGIRGAPQDILDQFSFIAFGADNLAGTAACEDSILNKGYLHQDIISRELIIYDMRNLLLYGHPVTVSPGVDLILKRVMTGIGFARRGLTGEVVRYTTPERKIRKAVSRIEEAEAIIKELIRRGASG